MSESDAAPRPRQLITFAGMVIGGSALLVLAVFDAMGDLESVDVRTSVTEALRSSAGLQVSVDQVLTLMRIGLNVAGVCAAAAFVAGIFVLQRHRGARTALGVLAVPILLTAPLTGSILGALVAAAIAMLWSAPVRDWYAGRSPRVDQRPAPEAPSEQRESTPERREVPALTVGHPSTRPAPTSGFGEAPTEQTAPASHPAPGPSYPPAPQHPHHPGHQPPPPAWTHAPRREAVPAGVRVACLLTWVCASAVAVVCVLALLVAVGDSQVYLDQLENNPAVAETGLQPDALLAMLWVVGLGLVAWAAAAAVLAVFVWRRQDWARYLLVVSAAAVLVAAMFAFPIGLPLQVACAVTIAMLVNKPARAWFTGRQAEQRQLW